MHILYTLLFILPLPLFTCHKSSGDYFSVPICIVVPADVSFDFPYTKSSDFAILKEYHTLTGQITTDPQEKERMKARASICEKRRNIMLEIENYRKKMSGHFRDDINALMMQELHWQTLRDTYPETSVHYSAYNNYANKAAFRNKKMILEQDIQTTLEKKTISPSDYDQIIEKSELFFGPQAQSIISKIPGIEDIRKRSLQKQTELYLTLLPSQKRFKRLARAYTATAALHDDLEKKQTALNTALHYDFLYAQKKMSKKVAQLESLIEGSFDASQTNTVHYKKLEKALKSLRSIYPVFHPIYEELSRKIAYTQLDRLYYAGEFNDLALLAEIETRQFEQAHIQRLIERSKCEQALSDLLQRSHTIAEELRAYENLFNTFVSEEPGRTHYAHKIQLKILELLEILDTEIANTDAATYWNNRLELKEQLARTYPTNSDEQTIVLREVALLKDIEKHEQYFGRIQTTLNQPACTINPADIHQQFVTLLRSADYINEAHKATIQEVQALPIKTEWIEEYIRYYELLINLKNLEQSNNDTKEDKKSLLTALIDSPLTASPERQSFLHQLIDLIEGSNPLETVTLQIRFVRNQLLGADALNQDERIYWNKELLKLNLTRQIRTLRNALENPDLSNDERKAINLALNKHYKERQKLMPSKD